MKWYMLLMVAALVLGGKADDDDDDDDDDRRGRRPKHIIDRPRRDYCTVLDKRQNNHWINIICNQPIGGVYECVQKITACDKGWKEFRGKCYLFAKCRHCTPTTSDRECKKHNAIQAKITSEDHQEFIVRNRASEPVAVGAHYVRGEWRWEDNTRVVYTNWHHKALKDKKKHKKKHKKNKNKKYTCAILGYKKYRGNYQWVDKKCNTKVKAYTCEKMARAIAQEEHRVCDKGWKEFKNKCYKFVACRDCTVESSEAACENLNAIQAKITSLAHHRFIVRNKPGQQVSVGAHDISGVWRWEDGSRVKYFKWHRGEPNRVGREKCMLLGWRHYQDDDWVDIGCNAKVNGYVCEKATLMDREEQHQNPQSSASEEFVGFSMGSRKGLHGKSKRIPLEVIIYNDGDHFHPSDNAFYAPYDGVYSFSFSVVADRGRWADVILYKQKRGGGKVGIARSIDRGINKRMGAAGANAMVELEKGESVFIWLVGYGLKACGSGNKPPCTLFSGKMEKRLYH